MWPGPDLDLSRYDLCTQAVVFSNIYRTLCESELFAARLTDPPATNVQTVFYTFDLTLTLHVTFTLKC